MEEQVQQIATEQIDPSPFQPRRRFDPESLTELAASIREHGVIQPILVRAIGRRFELIAGERRLRACREAGLATIPAIVRSYSHEQALETAIIENLQRQDITVVETARAFERLAGEFLYSHGEIARRTGKSRVAVTNTLRILTLPEPVLEMIDREELTEGHARALLALPYPSLQVEVAEWIARNAVPVREAESRIRVLLSRAEPRPDRDSLRSTDNPYLSALEERLRERFGTRVAVSYNRSSGSISLEFYGDDDLQRILELLGISDPD
jgi:ParB family chromosome partitioning protein